MNDVQNAQYDPRHVLKKAIEEYDHLPRPDRAADAWIECLKAHAAYIDSIDRDAPYLLFEKGTDRAM